MPQQIFTVSDNARVEIRNCHNRVTVVGWDDAHTIAVDFAARQEGATLIVENANKVTLRVPRAATITVTNCEADVRVDDLTGRVELANIGGDVALRNLRGETVARDLDGDFVAKDVASLKGEGSWDGDVALRDVDSVQIESVEGDINLSEVGSASVNQVTGDLVARGVKSLKGEGTWEGDVVLRGVEVTAINDVEGDMSLGDIGEFKAQTLGGDFSAQNIRAALVIEEIKGDVNVRDSSGSITIERVEGDFIASNLRGGLVARDIDGDAVVSFSQVAPLDLRADGDVVLNLPVDANAEVELDAPHGDLVARANLKVTAQDESHLHGTLGNGGVRVQAESTKGDLILRQNGAETHKERKGDYAEHADYAAYADFSHFADMGQRIAAEVRKSVQESLADMKVPEVRARHHRVEFRMHRPGRHHEHRHERDQQPESRENQVEEKPQGPVAGSPERKAILDAISRGELSVDDAIKKLSAE